MNTNLMIEILDQDVLFFTDTLNPADVYVEYKLANGAICFDSVYSRTFKAFLGCRYRELSDDEEHPKFKELLEEKCDEVIYHQNNKVKIHRRIAGSLQEGITYFLADDKWRYIIVSPKGYKVQNCSKLKFIKSPLDEAQVLPKPGGKYLDLILPKLNMSKDEALLYAVFLVQSFSRSSSHFAAVISSSKGTGKSTLTKMTAEIVAPTKTGVALQPGTEDDLKTMLANTYLAAFDNTETLPTTFSNILCAAITGSKASKRKLYTNSDQVVLNLHNLVLINGIDIVPYKSDLAERSLYFELLPIDPDTRRTDSEIWDEFHRDKPLILGAIFRTLAHAMRVLPTLKVPKLHRMADAHQEMLAIAVALGIDQNAFQQILDENNKKLQEAYATNSPFVDFVLTYLQTHPRVDDPAAKVYRSMEDSLVGDRGFFPKSPSMLSRRLNEERDALFEAGYRFERLKTKDSNYIKINRIPQSQQTKAQKEAAARRAAQFHNASTER